MLGVRWTRADANALYADLEGGTSKKRPEVLDWPLAAILEPELQNSVKKIFGSPIGIRPPDWASKSDEIVDLYEKPKEDFLSFVWSHVRSKVITG